MKGCVLGLWCRIGLIVGACLLPMPASAAWTPPPTIDRVAMYGFLYTSAPGLGFSAFTRTTKYFMSDGTSWASNYFYSYQPEIWLDHVETTADSVRYVFASGSDLWSETAFELVTQEDRTRRASYGTLGAARPITMRAAKGGTTAIMEGTATITGNDRAWNSPHGEPPFSYFSSVRGAVVPFRLTYQIRDHVWSEHIFDSTFTYLQSGEVDFAHPVSTPALTSLELAGSSHLPDGITVQYHAIAHYESGAEREVTSAARWSLAPGSPATQANGAVTIPTLAGSPASLVLTATYTEAGIERTTVRAIEATSGLAVAEPGEWSTLQGNARHTGHEHVALEPLDPRVLWTRTLDARYGVQPAVVAGGRVFATLNASNADTPQAFALDAATGVVLWSYGFGRVNSVNPPSYAYGNVYVQAGRPSGQHTDAALHALDAATGQLAFRTIFGSQGYLFLAPAVAGQTLYAPGGYGLGVESYDVFGGERRRLVESMPTQSNWGPAADEQRFYTYSGSLSAGSLSAWDRVTGGAVYATPDTGFNSYAQTLTPVLGERADVLVLNANRLMCWDRVTGALRWRLTRGFSGTPAVAHGIVYAIDGGRLVAIDEATGSDLWAWSAADGALAGNLVVCDSHVLCCTATTLHAVGLLSRLSEWSAPGTGSLALGDGVLFVAGATGRISAIQMIGSPTPTLIEDFRATRAGAEVELSWVLPNPTAVVRATVERATSSEGPWVALELGARQDGERGWATDPVEAAEESPWYRLVLAFPDGSVHRGLPVQATGAVPEAASGFALASANPVRGAARLRFGLATAAVVRLRVFDVHGREVEVVREGWAAAGEHLYEWRPASSVRAGLYFAVLELPDGRHTLRLSLVR